MCIREGRCHLNAGEAQEIAEAVKHSSAKHFTVARLPAEGSPPFFVIKKNCLDQEQAISEARLVQISMCRRSTKTLLPKTEEKTGAR